MVGTHCFLSLTSPCQTYTDPERGTEVWTHACADPESIVRGGLNIIFFFSLGERGSKYHYKWAMVSQPQAKRHLNGVSLVGR